MQGLPEIWTGGLEARGLHREHGKIPPMQDGHMRRELERLHVYKVHIAANSGWYGRSCIVNRGCMGTYLAIYRNCTSYNKQ